MNAAADGTLFVGSLATGMVVKFAPGSLDFQVLVAPGTLKNVAGVLVDDADGTVLVCNDDVTFASNAEVRRLDPSTGASLATYSFPSPAFCNDMAFDTAHNLYVTDSTGSIYTLANGSAATTFTRWLSDPLLAPSSASGFGADGIVYDGVGALYVNTFSDSRLLKIAVNGDGTAGAITQITVTPAITNPDGMRLVDANTVVIAGGGDITEVAVTGSAGAATILSNRMDSPTSLVKVGNYYFVSEGQLGHLFGFTPGLPNLPFLIQRIPAY